MKLLVFLAPPPNDGVRGLGGISSQSPLPSRDAVAQTQRDTLRLRPNPNVSNDFALKAVGENWGKVGKK